MLQDLQKNSITSEKTLNYDVIIIGAGAAGITIANKLANTQKKIALIEGGGLEYSQISQESYKGFNTGDKYFELDKARLRYFGGSTNHWEGQCRSFEKIDFNREYLGTKYNWPVTLDEIKIYNNEACSILEIPSYFNDVNIDDEVKQIEFHFSPPVRFKDKYLEKLKNSKNVDIYLNSSIVDFIGDSNVVKSAKFKSFSNNEIILSGKKFILAMGGIENCRFLLWILKKYNNKFFDSNLPIGKYWMEHPIFTLGRALINTSKVPGKYYSISENNQKLSKILNCGFRIKHLDESASNQLIRNLACFAPSLSKSYEKLMKKKLICGVEFRAAWEQEPNYNNSITLSKNTDFFEMPRPVLNWKKTELDRNTIKKSIFLFNNWLLNNNKGRIQLDDWILNNKSYPENDELAGYHHMGGTRMHTSKKFGVVDSNCKIYGSKNIYVAGSSIFTTGGHNNPTLPIVQFALRLSNYLIR